MQTLEVRNALGLYAGSSAVHINVCLLKTDGLDILDEPISLTRSYSPDLRRQILALSYPDDFANAGVLREVEEKITAEHMQVIQEFLDQIARHVPKIDVIGYSGHLVHLRTTDKMGIYLGSGDRLARQLHIPVVDQFAQADLQAGGVGGPLLATFAEAMTRPQKKPVVVVSLNGITSLTYIGSLGQQMAFDVGVGCLLLDKWVQRHIGAETDFDGAWASKGQVDQRLLNYLLKTDYLHQKPPKTLDREDFNALLAHVEGCSPADGAATLMEFVVQSIVQAQAFLPDKPAQWILTGGGTLNPVLVLRLKKMLPGRVETVSELNMPHYNLDAAAYAFLAVRSLMGLPITFPETTGAAEPICCGVYHATDPS